MNHAGSLGRAQSLTVVTAVTSSGDRQQGSAHSPLPALAGYFLSGSSTERHPSVPFPRHLEGRWLQAADRDALLLLSPTKDQPAAAATASPCTLLPPSDIPGRLLHTQGSAEEPPECSLLHTTPHAVKVCATLQPEALSRCGLGPASTPLSCSPGLGLLANPTDRAQGLSLHSSGLPHTHIKHGDDSCGEKALGVQQSLLSQVSKEACLLPRWHRPWGCGDQRTQGCKLSAQAGACLLVCP